ncbi:Catalase-peroxidase 2 [Escovopsis weberi]|uniref:Catalase-peroxidase n=1 Tax=Escovopsis weberi TaxID=150374 RepID=A0A0M8N2Y0_ESCWE|nr:Catalase-peroxidase 2 [Escovopsis weberi]
MPDPSLHKILALAVSVLPLANAVGCPYVAGNHAAGAAPRPTARSTSILDRRTGSDGSAVPIGSCPRRPDVVGGGTRSRDFWPCQLRLDVLRQNSAESNPLGPDFDYATEFAKLDVDQLKKDITALQTDSQSWWPADFGNYGPFWIRLAWHSAGTYRVMDGRGGSGMGQQRFAPLNGWADNGSLDKARRLLWPIKQKYGNALSWADLFALAGNTALENMGFPTYGFAFGRVDTWQGDEGTYWGTETEMFPGPTSDSDRYDGSTDIYARSDKLDPALADVAMALIYVDPRGPHGIPDPKASALDIRTTFSRMGMDDEETVALIAGGHAFGKTHGAVAGSNIGPDPNGAPIELQGLGWHNSVGTGSSVHSYTSGLEVIWSKTPTKWGNEFFDSLFTNNFTLVKSPDGAPQWEALDANESIPDPFIAGKFRKPTMMTSDLGLINDPSFKNISQTYWKNFDYFTTKFSQSWFKLLHRDMGPLSRYLGPDVPKSAPFLWQDPLPAATHQTIDAADVAHLKNAILNAPGLNVSNLVTTAWGSAVTFRISDKRGGANGARIALEPQVSFAANNPPRLKAVLNALRGVMNTFNKANAHKQVSLADLIVLGGNAAIEKAASAAGVHITVPFTPGRIDATQDSTDVTSFGYLLPKADGFRNYGTGNARDLTEELLVDKASLLTLTPPEMTVLVGGMRALNANYDGSNYGILTARPGHLTNDFFVNLLSMSTSWAPVAGTKDEIFVGTDRASGVAKYQAKRADLIFGSHPELRAIAEVYGQRDAQQKFVADFAAAWSKVMDLDRYDIKSRPQNNVQ